MPAREEALETLIMRPSMTDELNRDEITKLGQSYHTDSLPSCVPGHDGRLYPREGMPLSKCPTSLDPSTPKGRALLMAAGNPGDIDFSDQFVDRKGQRYIIVEAVDYLIFPDRGIDEETGQESTFARTVLFTRDGEIFRTTSAHAPHRIAAACDLWTREEWAAGIPFRITERKSKRPGRSAYHDIRVNLIGLVGEK